ncbi:MAG: hypothetical protein A2V67_01630 [Deltaproteobacteria bacterium RBG_13_61_14]|nr:MAG: hypothetical protein A2V67_01630 [Deltaproteobacteria bacterium RBG_13_61_14]
MADRWSMFHLVISVWDAIRRFMLIALEEKFLTIRFIWMDSLLINLKSPRPIMMSVFRRELAPGMKEILKKLIPVNQ